MIVPGWAGKGVTVTLKVLAVLEAQELLAVTEIVPLEAPTVQVMEVVVETQVQPEGIVQVYEVAPLIGEMLYV